MAPCSLVGGCLALALAHSVGWHLLAQLSGQSSGVQPMARSRAVAFGGVFAVEGVGHNRPRWEGEILPRPARRDGILSLRHLLSNSLILPGRGSQHFDNLPA
jgi:hypothetical protein